MKKMNKILCVVMSMLFLVNNVAFGEMKLASMNLATESRLAPMNTPEFLDIAKLTARLLPFVNSDPDFLMRRNQIETLISPNDEITDKTGEKDVLRKASKLGFYFRDKQVLHHRKTAFIPCWIKSKDFNRDDSKMRWYIACARILGENKCDLDFIKAGDCDLEEFSQENIGIILGNPDKLDLLVKRQMTSEEKESIARFVEQQNEADEIIADAIWNKKETIIDANSAGILTIKKFLRHFGNKKLLGEFARLAENKQIMYIPGLKKPHAGGVGIYLVNESGFEKNHQDQIVHELFAKCGLLHEENNLLVQVFNEWLSDVIDWWEYRLHSKNEDYIEEKLSESGNKPLFNKAKNASFENRWKDPYKIDYYEDNQKKVLTKRMKEFLESKIPDVGKVQTISFETLRNETGATYSEISYLLPELCKGLLFLNVRVITADGIKIARDCRPIPGTPDAVKKGIILEAKNRWKYELNKVLKEPLIRERAEEYLRKKTESGKFSMILLTEWQKETESLDPKESFDLLYSLCAGLDSVYVMESFYGKDHLFFSPLPHFVIYRYDAKELVDVKEKKTIIQRFLREEFKRDLSADEGSLPLQLMDFDPVDGLSKHLTKKDIADLFPEVCFAADSEFVLEDVFKSSAMVRINNCAKDVKKQQALSISEKVGMKAKWRISLREALGVAVSERMRAESLSENPIEKRDKTKKKILPYEGLDNTTIIDTASREIKALLSSTDESPVFFMPRELTHAERCQALTKEYAGAKFVPFDQSNLSNLNSQLEKYPACRKVVVTIGADYKEIKSVYEKHNNLMPLNFSRKNIEDTLSMNTSDTRRKELEKTVISIALLTGALPAEGYESTFTYSTLVSLLNQVMLENSFVEEYIESLINFAAGDSEKLSFLIQTRLKPIDPYDVQELRFIVKTLISA